MDKEQKKGILLIMLSPFLGGTLTQIRFLFGILGEPNKYAYIICIISFGLSIKLIGLWFLLKSYKNILPRNLKEELGNPET